MKKLFLSGAMALSFWASGLSQTPFTLHLNPMVGTTPIALDQDFAQHGGQMADCSRIQYYISNVGLVHDGGQVTYLDSTWLLVSPVRTFYVLPQINITNIEKIRFSVGVGADVNHNDPALWPAGHPLAIQSPGMHWGWTAGYKFAAFEGNADNDSDGVPNQMWQIHPTGDQLLRNVEVAVTPVITGNGVDIYLEYDMREWLRDINLAIIGADHSDGPSSVTVMNNINTYNVFRAAGTPTSSTDAFESDQPSLHFNYVEAERPIVYFKGNPARGSVKLQVVDMAGQVVFVSGNLLAEGKARIETRLAKGMYTCSMIQQGQVTLSKKFQVF